MINAVFLSANYGAMHHNRAEHAFLTRLRFEHGVKSVAVDKINIAFVQYVLVFAAFHKHAALDRISEFKLLMPVPAHKIIRNIGMIHGYGELRISVKSRFI